VPKRAEGPNKVWPLPPSSSSIAALIEHYPFQIRHFVLRLDPIDKLYHVRNDPAFHDPLKLIQEYYRNEWPIDKSVSPSPSPHS
jgi:hypothetical protein